MIVANQPSLAARAEIRRLEALPRPVGALAVDYPFVAETGLTFGAWRQRLRLLRALELLGAGQPVGSVAYGLGYDSPSAFTAMFRRALGAPPLRYLTAGGSEASSVSR